MDPNYSNGRYAFIKDPINCQTNSTYNYETYQSSYYDAELKDRNYYNNRVNSYPVSANSFKVDQSQLYRSPVTLSQSVGSTSSSTVAHKSQSYKGYNYNTMPPDNNYYTFYDQYQFNVNPKVTQPLTKAIKMPTDYNGYAPPVQVQQQPKIVSNPMETNNQITKTPSATSVGVMRNHNVPHYPYGNYYNFSTTAPSYQQSPTNQNYYSAIAQGGEDSRWSWGDYSNTARTLPTYFTQEKSNHQEVYPTDSVKIREKSSYNSVYHAANSENGYGFRARHLWPMPVQYQPSMSQQNVYDRCPHSNLTQSQTLNCCSMRQDDTSVSNNYYQQNYPQYNTISGSQSVDYKFREATRPNDFYQQSYTDISHMYPSDPNIPIRYNNLTDFSTDNLYVSTEKSIDEQNNLRSYQTYSQHDLNQQSRYTTNQLIQSQADVGINSNKIQNLREFLSSWNEDEDENIEKFDKSLIAEDVFLESSIAGHHMISNSIDHIEAQSNVIDNQLQLKSSYSTITRPKIHVGITVDSSIGSSQFINLPDIIIDIEKSKEPVQSTHINETEPTIGNPALSMSTLNMNQTQTFVQPIQNNSEQLVNYSCDKTLLVNNKLPTENTVKESYPLLPLDMTQSSDLKYESLENNFNIPNTPIIHTERIEQKNQTLKKIIKSLKNRKKSQLKRLSVKKSMLKPGQYKHVLSLRRFRKPQTNRTDSTQLNTPDSLKRLCLAVINTDKFRKVLEISTQIVPSQTETNDFIPNTIKINNSSINTNDIIPIDSDENDTKNSDDNNIYFELETQEDVPKLSDLCKNALNSSYEREDVVVINLDEILDSDNLFVIQCDVNENILDSTISNNITVNNDHDGSINCIETHNENQIKNDIKSRNDDEVKNSDLIENFEQTEGNGEKLELLNINHEDEHQQLQEDQNHQEFQDHYQQQENQRTEDNLCKIDEQNSNENYSNIELDYFIDNNNSNKNSNLNDEKLIDNEILVSSTFHHEEIVPDNYKKFENEKFLKYLHSKYVQRNISQIYHTNRILKKYRKGIIRKILQIVK